MTHHGTGSGIGWGLVACVSAVLSIFALPVERAAACTVGCGHFVPGYDVTIPSNTPALAFVHSGGSLPDIRLTRIDEGRSDPVAIRVEPQDVQFQWAQKLYLIRPDDQGEGLVEGARYRLHDMQLGSDCMVSSQAFEVGPKAEFPAALGTLTATDSFTEMIKNECPANPSYWGAHSWLNVSLDKTTTPWLHLLLYRSVVNQAVGNYNSDIAFSGAQGEVQIRCSDDGQPASTPFDAYVEVMIPGLAETLKTESVAFDLNCEKKPAPPTQAASAALAAGAGGSALPAAMPASEGAASGCSIVAPSSHPGACLWSVFACALSLGRLLARTRRRARITPRILTRHKCSARWR